MDHWHCQHCGAEQVTAPLSVARTKLAKSRHKLASHVFCNMTLFFIYFFGSTFQDFFFLSSPTPCILVPNPLTSEASANKNGSTKLGQRHETRNLLQSMFFVALRGGSSHCRAYFMMKCLSSSCSRSVVSLSCVSCAQAC